MTYFEQTEMPKAWREEMKQFASAISVQLLQEFGPLAVLVYCRIERASKDDFDMFDLSIVNIQNSNGGNKFIQRIMGFFNYNFKMSQKSNHHLKKVRKLLAVLPSLKELRQGFKLMRTSQHKSEKAWMKLMIYKVCLTIHEFYLTKTKKPSQQLKELKKVYSCMLEFYANSEEEDLMRICSELKFLSICF